VIAVDFTEDTATDEVVASFAGTPNARLRELLTGLVRHLHAFVREAEPTLDEWRAAIDFLTATGQLSD
jgi:hydroxyquinol 1,2-dioxygenase